MENKGENALLMVAAEREIQLNYFDSLIADKQKYQLFFATASDEVFIAFYNYVKRLSKQLALRKDKTASVERDNEIVSELEKSSTITEHLEQDKETQINGMVKLIEEKQRLRKMGPIRRLFNKNKNNK